MNNKSPIFVSLFAAVMLTFGLAASAVAATASCSLAGAASVAGGVANQVSNSCVPDDYGQIKIIKRTVGGAGTFDFAIDGPTDLTPNLPVGANTTNNTGYLNVLTGTYSVGEPAVPAGWYLTSVRCVKGLNAVVDEDNFTLAKGERVVCTFTNTKTGHLIVEKTTDPADDDTVFNINTTGSGTIIGGGAGTISDDKDMDYEVTPGTYTVAETVPDGWTKTGSTCTNVKVRAGETKTCLIANSLKAKITIEKVMLGGEGTFSFDGVIDGDIDDNNGTLEAYVGAGTFTVTEEDAKGWVLTDITCKGNAESTGDVATATATFVVEGGDEVTCTFTNEKKAKIIVKKEIEGTAGPDFAFSGAIVGTISEDGKTLEAYVDAGEYEVTEAATAGWDLTAIDCSARGSGDVGTATASYDVEAGDEITCTFTNTQRGQLIVQKTTDPAADSMVFDITASGTGTIIGGGSGTVTDASDMNYTVMPGTYSVEEAAVTGWTQTQNTCDDVEVAAGDTESCQITNAKNGRIVVYKETTPAGDDGEFTITAQGEGVIGEGERILTVDSPVTYDVAPGTYDIEEANEAAWDENDDNCEGLVVAAGAEVSCTIYNTANSAGLTLVKVVDNNYGGILEPDDFNLLVNGDEVESGIKNQVAAGIYTVSEDDPILLGYAQTGIVCVDDDTQAAVQLVNNQVTLVAGQNVTCTITNEDIQPTLQVFKVVENGPAVISNFTLFVDTTQVTSGEVNDFNAGTYTVNENIPANLFFYDEVWFSGDCDEDTGEVTLNPGDTKVCTIHNKDAQAANLIVIKKVDNSEGGTAVPGDFEITVTGVNVFNPVFDGQDEPGTKVYLDAGDYLAVEKEIAGYEVSYENCDGDLTIGETKTCTITNKFVSADTTLKLLKVVTNNNGGTALPGAWQLTATGNANSFTDSGDSVTFHNVTAGVDYTLTESVVNGYAAGSWSCDGGTLVNGVVTLAAGETVTCTVTNDDIAPSLKLYKVVDCQKAIGVSCTPNDCAKPSDFVLYATGTLASPTNLSGLTPVASNSGFKADIYYLTEDGPTGYTGTWQCTGGIFDSLANSIMVSPGQTAECTVTNVKNQTPPPVRTGTLKVVKIAIGGDGTQSFSFTGTGAILPFTLTPVKGSWGLMAKATWISGALAAGKYKITETVPAGWKQTSNSCKNVKVRAGKETTCVIVNVKRGCENTCHTGCNNNCNSGCGGNQNNYGLNNNCGQLTRK